MMIDTRTTWPRHPDRAALAILAAYIVVATVFGLANPLWEAFDEDGHYAYVRYVATRHAIPQAGDPDAEAIWEKFQTPLYYLLGALVIQPVDLSDDLQPAQNPYFTRGTAGINYAVHGAEEDWPYRGTALAIHLLRLLSTAIGAAGVWCTYRLLRTLLPAQPWLALAAMALHAFWPQFLFNSSAVTNDVLAATMGSLITLLLARWLRRPPGARALLRGLGPALGIGAALALGLLSKVNLLAYYPVAAVAIAWPALRAPGAWPRRLGRAAWLAVWLAPTVAAWWLIAHMPYVRLPLLGAGTDLLSPASLTQSLAVTPETAAWDLLGKILRYSSKTFFASFGWGNLELAPAVYALALAAALAALAGAVWAQIRRPWGLPGWALPLCAALVALVEAQMTFLAVQRHDVFLAPGRYLLPMITPLMALLAVGGGALAQAVWRRWGHLRPARRPLPAAVVPSVLLALLVAQGLYIPLAVIRPAYAPPPALTLEQAAAEMAAPLGLTFGGSMELLGYRLAADDLLPGRYVELTLYWRCAAPMEANYTVAVQALDYTRRFYGGVDGYPGGGNFATRLWQPGDVFADHYRLRLGKDFPAPGLAQMQVTVYDRDVRENLAVSDASGAPAGDAAVFGRLRVGARESAFSADAPPAATFGGAVALQGVIAPATLAAGEAATIILNWQTLAPLGGEYTVFLHLVGPDGQTVAQADAPPANGAFPTDLWAAGDQIVDTHTLAVPADAPAGDYTVQLGFYRPDTGERLPVADAAGAPLPDGQYTVEGLSLP